MKVENSKSRVQFYWFLLKTECSALCQNKFLLISLIEYSGISLGYSKLINLTKEQQNIIHRLITKFCVETIYIFSRQKHNELKNTATKHAVRDKVFKK